MRIAGIDFPEPLLTALRDGRLVIFAGAGVSMGPPARLPGFRELARQVAEGTGKTIGENEAEDRFLDRVKAGGPNVHQLAADLLKGDNLQPAELHRHLLRLYAKGEDVRIVTTNFDLLFEQAAADIFPDAPPMVFHAPALPLGRRFQGIAHIHGSVSEPGEMILTSEDFGRAYLTEADGWARRFLVDLFSNFTVLFAGYSHNDTIMTYLTPSVPRHNDNPLFTLIGEKDGTQERWKALGITPIQFPQAQSDDYSQLDKAVADLAHYLQRGVLDWRSEITRIASGTPPLDEELSGIIDYALSDPVLTRFFADTAESPEWIDWLDRRDYLAALFADSSLKEQEEILAGWLANRFAIAHTDALFTAIRRHGARLNPVFWNRLGGKIGHPTQNTPDAEILTRWVLFLISDIPAQVDSFILLRMAEACAGNGALVPLLMVYDAMTAILNRPLTHGYRWNHSEIRHYRMREIWKKCLKSNLPEIAESLLERTVRRLEERHSMLKAWRHGNDTWDSDSHVRSAIEPHSQDNYPKECDTLIDIAQDCLEWISANRVGAARLWSERYVTSQAPLLRRLAIHTLTARTDLSADGKIAWLLEHCDIHDIAAHHEIFRAAGDAYPQSGPEQRESLVKEVLEYRWPDEAAPGRESRSAHRHFTWLHWLNKKAPDDALTGNKLRSIREQYPDFLLSEHPDFTHYWSGFGRVFGKPSPWSVPELLAIPPAQWLPMALAQQPGEPEFDPRDQLIDNVEEAARQRPRWGIELATAMSQADEWDTALWNGVIDGWSKAHLNDDELADVLAVISTDELHDKRGNKLAYVMNELIGKNRLAFNTDTLASANNVARNLWQYMPSEDHETNVGWMHRAINHPAGRLAQYWVSSIARWQELQESSSVALSDEYRDILSEIMANRELPGTLARVVFNSHLSFLASIDEEWVRHNLIPILSPNNGEFESALNGLTYYGRMYPQTAELLRELILNAVEHVLKMTDDKQIGQFVWLYTTLLEWFVNGPTDEWITKLFVHDNAEARRLFAERIGHILRASDEIKQREMWDAWLKGYWQNRLLGRPVPLDNAEIEVMLEWTSYLTATYPEAIKLAVQMRPIQLQHGIMLHELANSTLPTEYPEAVAKLLIHIGKVPQNLWLWHGIKEVIDKLLQSNLDSETETSIKELTAKIGMP